MNSNEYYIIEYLLDMKNTYPLTVKMLWANVQWVLCTFTIVTPAMEFLRDAVKIGYYFQQNYDVFQNQDSRARR